MPTNTHSFQAIGLISKRGEPRITLTLQRLLQHLEDLGRNILLDESNEGLLAGRILYPREELGKCCDLVIVIGGDGTLLNAGRTLARFKLPIIGINQGRLGFLTDISSREMIPALNQILQGNFTSEARSLLSAEIWRGKQRIITEDAVNDIVIHNHDVVRMIEFDTYIDQRHVNTQRADGLVVATPTGSTAYALSAGGPLVAPSLDAILLVPICPHTMSNRPLIISAEAHIEIRLHELNRTSAQVAFDGQATTRLLPGDCVLIRQNTHKLQLLHPADYDHFTLLRKKLHWAEAPQENDPSD